MKSWRKIYYPAIVISVVCMVLYLRVYQSIWLSYLGYIALYISIIAIFAEVGETSKKQAKPSLGSIFSGFLLWLGLSLLTYGTKFETLVKFSWYLFLMIVGVNIGLWKKAKRLDYDENLVTIAIRLGRRIR